MNPNFDLTGIAIFRNLHPETEYLYQIGWFYSDKEITEFSRGARWNWSSAEMERLEADFAANGDRAVKAAEEADTDQSKASLLNVAVRSYLKAGGAKDQDLLSSQEKGLNSCSRLSGDNALPATCGYFYIVVPQAINNEWARKIYVIERKQKKLADDEWSPVEDGKTLV